MQKGVILGCGNNSNAGMDSVTLVISSSGAFMKILTTFVSFLLWNCGAFSVLIGSFSGSFNKWPICSDGLWFQATGAGLHYASKFRKQR
jgi:hypothetical protein